MNWKVLVAAQAQKSLHRLPRNIANRLVVILDQISVDPYSGDIRKIKGYTDTWRRRVGRYRITYSIFVVERVIAVTDIEIKTDNTYR